MLSTYLTKRNVNALKQNLTNLKKAYTIELYVLLESSNYLG